MSRGDDEDVASEDWPAPRDVGEAMVLWQFCARLADRLWEQHQHAFTERLLAEQDERRCAHHPWHRQPCATCADETGTEENLTFVFGDDLDDDY